MKTIVNKRIKGLIFTLLISPILWTCGTAPAKSNPEMVGNIFELPVEKVLKAGKDALFAIQCDTRVTESLYLECHRPFNSGLLVKPGGETVSIYFESLAPNKTQVYVNTAKTSLGYLAQSNWDDEVIMEMKAALAKK